MPPCPSTPLHRLAPPLLRPPQFTPIWGRFGASSPRFQTPLPPVPTSKSFGIIVGPAPGVGQAKIKRKISPELPTSGNCQNWKPPIVDRCTPEAPGVLEARYAYYRRCRQRKRNGEQCKAPAMTGEDICYRHAEQADAERRRQLERRELLSRPGTGFGSFRAIQRTISEVAQEIFAGTIDPKTASRLAREIGIAIRLQKISVQLRRKGALPLRTLLEWQALAGNNEVPEQRMTVAAPSAPEGARSVRSTHAQTLVSPGDSRVPRSTASAVRKRNLDRKLPASRQAATLSMSKDTS